MKKVFFILICAVSLPFIACAQTQKWKIGATSSDNVIAVYTPTTETLTISGTGRMLDWNRPYDRPWNDVRYRITSVIIEDGITSIGEFAFWDCVDLTTIEIPSSITEIGYEAFGICVSLTFINIPSFVTLIGGKAFADCRSLISVTIPSSVTKIGYGTFAGCESLTSISVADNNPNYVSENGVLFDKDKKILVAYPERKQDSRYTIPNRITKIEELAFWHCTSLTSITIPSSVTSIGNRAFAWCTSLISVHVEWDDTIVIDVDANVFADIDLDNVTLYVPAGRRSVYANAPVWKDFGKIIEHP
jgi:hypothetical protein